MKTESKATAKVATKKRRQTKREQLVRQVADRFDVSMVSVAHDLKFKSVGGFYNTLRARHPRFETVVPIRDWLSARGVTASIEELMRD